MQAHRHLKLALICTVALALPVSAAAAAGAPAVDGPPAKHAKLYRHACPINNPDYAGPKPRRR
jgi:hypothetical protein